MANRDRTAAYKQRMKEKGLVQGNFWLPAHKLCQLRVLASILLENPHLEVGMARDTVSGKWVKIPI